MAGLVLAFNLADPSIVSKYVRLPESRIWPKINPRRALLHKTCILLLVRFGQEALVEELYYIPLGIISKEVNILYPIGHIEIPVSFTGTGRLPLVFSWK